MKKENNTFKIIHIWAGEHSLAGLAIGTVLFILPIMSLSQPTPKHPMFRLLIFVLELGLIYGTYLSIWSFVSLLKKGSRVVEFLFGILLFLVGISLTNAAITNYQVWAHSLEGSAIKFGPIVLPGIVLIILVPAIGLMLGGYGIYRIINSFLTKKKRKIR